MPEQQDQHLQQALSRLKWTSTPSPERDKFDISDEYGEYVGRFTIDEAFAYLEWYGRDEGR